jgi:hypothetical protein
MERELSGKSEKLSALHINRRKLRMVKDAAMTRQTIALEQLIDAGYDEFHDKEKEGLYYHQSFAVIDYFMLTTRGKAVRNYMKELKKTKDVEAANAKLFGKERKNLSKVEKKWKSYILKIDIR